MVSIRKRDNIVDGRMRDANGVESNNCMVASILLGTDADADGCDVDDCDAGAISLNRIPSMRIS